MYCQRHQCMNIRNEFRVLSRWLALTAATLFACAAQALCPFNPLQQRLIIGTSPNDGLAFVRYALGLALGNPNNVGTPQAATNFITTRLSSIDIDGDGEFTVIDAQIIARYQLGYRNAALKTGLPTTARAQRTLGDEYQIYIENGCTADPRVSAWNQMLLALQARNPARAKRYLTTTALEKYEAAIDALSQQLPDIIDSFSELLATDVYENYAEYAISRPVPNSTNGARTLHLIAFARLPDGSWRVDSM